MALIQVRVPDIGEAENVEVIEITSEKGAEVAIDDALIVIESDKASMEVPAPVAGTIEVMAVSLGDVINEGDLIAEIKPYEQASKSPDQSDETEKDNEKLPSPTVAASTDLDEGQDTQNVVDSGGKHEIEVLVPDIGEAENVSVIEIGVSVGSKVKLDDMLVVIESDKASMEIPSPISGIVLSVEVSLDEEVQEGSLIAVIETTEGPHLALEVREIELESKKSIGDSVVETDRPPNVTQPEVAQNVYAGPGVRRLSRELGVDLTQVKSTGPHGRIVKDDVKAFVKASMVGGGEAESSSAWPAVKVPDYQKYGDVETESLSRVRVSGAENLHRSWVNVVHVTQHDEADITDLEEFRGSLRKEAEDRGTKLTPLAFLLKASAANLRKYPQFNASLGSDSRTIILKKYINIGFAVDTDEGLVVPVIRDIDKKAIWALAEEVAELSDLARQGQLKPDQMVGGCFTISSLGPLGGTGFTPIVNAPEVAILGVARMSTKPVWNGSDFVPRKVLPLSLSYDHRAINGAEGGRFMMALIELLQDVRRFIL